MTKLFQKTFIRRINHKGFVAGIREGYHPIKKFSTPTEFLEVKTTTLQLSDYAKERIKLSEKQLKEGKFKTLEEIKKKFLK